VDNRIFLVEEADQIENYYKVANIFVLPSLKEGLPNSLLEAMACGVPVISSRLDGVTDWVIKNGINGILIDPNNKNQLQNSLKNILSKQSYAQLLGIEANKSISENFSIKRVAKQYIDLYKKTSRYA